MTKNKRKNDEGKSCLQQIVGCSNLFIRLLAGLLMLVFIGMTIYLFYMKSQLPEFNITVLVLMTCLLAYVCWYVAFNRSKKMMSTGRHILSFFRLIAWALSTFIMVIAGFSIILIIGMLFQYPEPTIFFMLIFCIILTITSGYISKTLRPVKEQERFGLVFIDEEHKNDWLKDYSEENDDE